MNLPLAGVVVVVTRPARQAERFIRLLQGLGSATVAFPTMAIEPVLLDPATRAALAPNAYDWVIYTSANAVGQSQAQIDWPSGGAGSGGGQARQELAAAGDAPRPRVAAIGRATARALADAGIQVDALPLAGADSEALLALPQFSDPRGLNVLIVKGVGGRDTLRAGLAERGAQVTTAEVYRRALVSPSDEALRQLESAPAKGSPLVAVTSVEVLESLLALAPDPRVPWLRDAPLVVPGDRVAAHAQRLGWRGRIVVARSAEDDVMLEAVREWRAGRGGRPAA